MAVVVKVFFLALLSARSASSDPLTIGGIFYQDADDLEVALTLSAKMYNFTSSIKKVSGKGEILEIGRHVCELAEEGVVGIIDGIGGRASEHIQALCDMLELPHVAIQHNDLYNRNWSLINLHPSPITYDLMVESLINVKDWRNFTILYARGRSLVRVNNLLQMGNRTEKYIITVRELSGNDYRQVLTDAKHSGYVNFVVDCPSSDLETLLLHAQQVDLMADEQSYIFISPDLFTLDLSRYRYGGVNMTGFRLTDLSQNKLLEEFTSAMNNETGQTLHHEELKTKLVLIYDAVMVFSEAIKKVQVKTQPLSCESYETWIYGSSLLNFMKTNKVEGITRALNFDGLGQRVNVYFDIMELTPAGTETVGTWDGNKLNISRTLMPEAEISGDTIMKNKTFKVLIAMVPPYVYMKESSLELEGNDRYEGFAIDLIDMLADQLGFNYVFDIESTYGSYNAETGKWNGMVLQLREDKADFAICDFTMTAERQRGIDFSRPFMTLGIGILYREPGKQPPEMFSFMAVFSKEVWYYMVLVQLGLGVIMIIVGRISNKEWQNPLPCVEQPEELINQFSFANSVWLIIGSVMQQGSEIAPIALAPRLITSVWWFFTMIIMASYVGTLVAFLTIENKILPFETVDELYKRESIAYGAKETGSTVSFFKESSNAMYKSMHEKMSSKGWLVKDNDIGVERAEKEKYAFFMESTTIEYYIERHCDLIQVGGLLDSKSYGIGMKKGSRYKKYIDDALLKLQEQGDIEKLKVLWWKEKRGGGKCGVKDNETQKQLGMKHMYGAFVVLGVGSLIGLVISILDMLWGVFKRTVKYKTTFKFELIEELKFAIKFSGDMKPVKRPPKPDGSAEALAEIEGKDEIRSLKSIRSGMSTDTHRTNHSHSSKHSSGDLTVAFARRRKYS